MSERTTFHVRRAVDGDRESLEWVVEHFGPFVESQVRFRLGGRGTQEDVEDLAGEVWLVALRRLHQLEARESRMSPVLVRYLGTTALQACNNFLRKLARANVASAPGAEAGCVDPDDWAVETKGLVSRVAERELAAKIRSCLERLPEQSREILVLRLMEQLRNAEIAELLGIPPNTVATRYRKAVERLRAILPTDVFDEIRTARAAVMIPSANS